MELLLEKGANIHAKNDLALGLAARNGHRDVVELLLENGTNISARNYYALRWAAIGGHKDVTKLLTEGWGVCSCTVS